MIEDRFAAKRLPLEQLDVLVTGDVRPYENMKLRLLNASHSCLAYLAALRGHELVHDAMADATIEHYVRSFLELEAAPALPPVPGVDKGEYVASLIARYSNPAIADQISRLCLDGTPKFPKFLLPTIADQLANGRSVALSALGLAGWCQYLVGGLDDAGRTIRHSPDPDLGTAIGEGVAERAGGRSAADVAKRATTSSTSSYPPYR